MGKRIIIKDANFSTNKIVQQPYVELTTTTVQGVVVTNTESSNFGKLGQNKSGSTWFYNKYVHSNQAIILHPGDTIAIVERPNTTTRAFICAYSDVKNIYPALECTDSTQEIGTLVAGKESFPTKCPNAINSSILPRVLKHYGTKDWYVVLQLNNNDHAITASNTESDYYIGEIKYRIYTDNPTQYDQNWTPEAHPGTFDPDEEETNTENSELSDDNPESNGEE